MNKQNEQRDEKWTNKREISKQNEQWDEKMNKQIGEMMKQMTDQMNEFQEIII